MALEIDLFTDPACPFAFSAEPIRQRLRWYYGDQLDWRLTMIVLTLEPGEAEKLAAGAPGLQRRHGMPIDPAPYSRPSSSEPACRAVVAARLNAPWAEAALLRRLRVRRMAGGLLDDPALIAAAARDAGLDPAGLEAWCATAAVEDALQADIERARDPAPGARALDHKLGGPPEQRRYTAPSYELRHDGRTVAIPGYNPVEVYEAAIANLAPELVRRPRPTVEELLAWADEPLATAEVIAITGLDPAVARTTLSRVARAIPSGADCYWTAAPDRARILAQLSVRRGPEAIAFYKAAFGAVEDYRVGDEEIVAQLSVGDATFWVADESPEHANFSPETIGGGTVRMLLIVADPAAAVARAVAAGATLVAAVDDAHGWRLGRVADPFGHHWEIGKPLIPWPPAPR